LCPVWHWNAGPRPAGENGSQRQPRYSIFDLRYELGRAFRGLPPGEQALVLGGNHRRRLLQPPSTV